MRSFLNIIVVSLFLFSSCVKNDSNVIIDKKFDNDEWSRFEYLEGSLNVTDNDANNDLFMELFVTDVYPNPYENHQKDGSFLFNLTISNSNGLYRSRDYKFMLKDKDGFWNAEKKDGYYVFKLPIINGITFSDIDIYTFKIENKYPKDPVSGINRLTLKYIESEIK